MKRLEIASLATLTGALLLLPQLTSARPPGQTETEEKTKKEYEIGQETASPPKAAQVLTDLHEFNQEQIAVAKMIVEREDVRGVHHLASNLFNDCQKLDERLVLVAKSHGIELSPEEKTKPRDALTTPPIPRPGQQPEEMAGEEQGERTERTAPPEKDELPIVTRLRKLSGQELQREYVNWAGTEHDTLLTALRDAKDPLEEKMTPLQLFLEDATSMIEQNIRNIRSTLRIGRAG